jgi:ribosomal protein L34E
MEFTKCGKCGNIFQCRVNDIKKCWCNNLEKLPPELIEPGGKCICKKCLQEKIEAYLKVQDKAQV